MPTPKSPIVSIGLPVFNGENFIAQAIESILNQTFTDFELIISDNSSSDRTQEICLDFQKKDPRIQYHRHSVNRGAAWNHNRCVELSRGVYFKWMAHDDLCAPSFIQKCLDALQTRRDTVLCHPAVTIIDQAGRKVRDDKKSLRTESLLAHERFHDLIHVNHACFAVYGVIRSEVLKKTRLIGGYPASDRVLLAELGLAGPFYKIPERLCFIRRLYPGYISKLPRHKVRNWFDPARKRRIIFPEWHLYGEYIKLVKRAPISLKEKTVCARSLMSWALK